ncbi:hypothetical protein AGABI1DRAFT_18833, partial [Agaricus bisporus var. burnettii JB137-S8]
MSHPTFWPKKSFFYPIGNTPPVSLTDHLPPEGAATILLLGCGDPRHILYTITTDHGIPTRSMDFTCCDWEPAIIARNALLFTFMYDSVEDDRLLQYWSIFYDLFLDKRTASLLSKQCKKLVEYAADFSTWDNSPYGNFLKFATQDTLDEARRHWKSYEETIVLSNAKQKQLKQMFLSGMKQKAVAGADASAIPSAAPISFQFTSFKTYTKYWNTGITNPTVGSNTPTQINPTFLFSVSGRRFQLHYGTDLCSSFHLALTQAKHSFTDGPISTPAKTERAVWDACRAQFSRWAKALFQRVRAFNQPPELIIRLVVGDALAFCEGLQLCQTGDFTPTVYSSAWGGKKFLFNDTLLPTFFDVIDTSNLSDHLGLLNVLIAAVPLLQKSPRAILNTNSLLSYKDHPTKRSALEERALSDFPSLMLFLGITPICYSSGLTFRNGSEAAFFSEVIAGKMSGRHYERVSWRFSDYTHARWNGNMSQRNHEVRLEPKDLADKLLSVYLKMFESENIGSRFSRLAVGDVNLLSIQNPHYHRQSFVRFIKVIRSLDTMEVNWQKAISHFIDLVLASRELLVGSNNFQNLFAELHLWDVYSESNFFPGYVAREYQTKTGVFETWGTVPPVVCVVLKVPRSALKVLEDMDEDEVGHPILECETFCNMLWHNLHSSIRPIFGDIIDSSTNPGKKVIVEDDQGLAGNSPLIVSFFVPSWILAQGSNGTTVGLCIKSTGADSARFMSKLGLELRLYSTKVSDRNHVFICTERPDNEGELQKMVSINPPRPHENAGLGLTTISFGNTAGRELVCKRLDVTAPRAKEALMNKASVEVKQITPFCMKVIIGKLDRYSLFYPVAVDGSRSKTRIARKSSYIEVELPSRDSPFSQVTLQPFPVTQCSEASLGPICWNAPYMKIDNFPTVAISGDAKWVSTHLGMTLSHHERRLQQSDASNEEYGPMMNFKMSIGNAFLLHVRDKTKVHFLMDSAASEPFAIMFLSSIRFDLSSATVVGDAVIIIMEPSIKAFVAHCLRGTAFSTISVDVDEVCLWYQALPVFAERCRQWQHLPTCEYLQQQRIPLSSERGKNPICSCGKGKNLGAFGENSRWKALVPHATRIALAPIFPVTYLEDVTEQGLKTALKSRDDTSTATPRSSNGCQNCGKTGTKLSNCSACQSVKYCSKDCQLVDWMTHKSVC